MTIPKRDKRRARVKSLAQPPTNKMVESPPVNKVILYPRVCPYCQREGFSTICRCGRLTKLASTK